MNERKSDESTKDGLEPMNGLDIDTFRLVQSGHSGTSTWVHSKSLFPPHLWEETLYTQTILDFFRQFWAD